MNTENYKSELNKLKIELPSEKLLDEISHTLEVRGKDFKFFFESEEEKSILKENEQTYLSELLNYEKELKIGENGN